MFCYCSNNPTNIFDPTGKVPIRVMGAYVDIKDWNALIYKYGMTQALNHINEIPSFSTSVTWIGTSIKNSNNLFPEKDVFNLYYETSVTSKHVFNSSPETIFYSNYEVSMDKEIERSLKIGIVTAFQSIAIQNNTAHT